MKWCAILVPIGWLLLVIGVGLPRDGAGQTISLKLGQKEISQGQPFTITLQCDEELPSGLTFPEIIGMDKVGLASRTATTQVGGRLQIEHTLTQRYIARRPGTYHLSPFRMRVGKRSLEGEGATITVTAGGSTEPDAALYDPFEDFFQGRSSRGRSGEYAFFRVLCDKEQVFAGEGFHIRLSFFVSEANPIDMEFVDLGTQLSAILKKLRPSGTWEENFLINQVQPRSTRIGGRSHTEYPLWEATFYPFEPGVVTLPAVGLEMITYTARPGAMDDPFGRRRQRVTFRSQEQRIRVRPLPDHPLKGRVPVGQYTLTERLGRRRVTTGESVAYEFIIRGEGNISALEPPTVEANESLEIYPPTLSQNLYRQDGRVTGQKTYRYLIAPRMPGPHPLRAQGFRMYYFDPKAGRYDSLVSRISLEATGPARRAGQASTSDYDDSQRLGNRLGPIEPPPLWIWVGNSMLAVLTLGGLWVMTRKPRG